MRMLRTVFLLLVVAVLILALPISTALAEETTGTISGHVYQSGGGGVVPGGVVICTSTDCRQTWAWIQEDGSFAFSGLAPGSYSLRTDCGIFGYADEWYDGEDGMSVWTSWGSGHNVDVPTSGVLTIDFYLDPGWTISGTVKDPDGGPLLVGVVSCETTYWATAALIDAEGRYAIKGVPNGTYRVRTNAAQDGFNYVDQVIKITVADVDAAGVDFVLSPGRIISGTVTGLQEGEWITVTARNEAGSWYYAQTDSTGSYSFLGLPDGIYTVETHAAWADYPYVDQFRLVDVLEGDAAGIDFYLSMSTAHSISGTVFGLQLGEWIWVTASGDGGYYQVQTNLEGAYLFEGLPDGTYTVETHAAWNEEYSYLDQSRVVQVVGSDVTGIDFYLENLEIPGATISGSIADSSGTPLEGVVVRVYEAAQPFMLVAAGYTDEEGEFWVRGLDPGIYWLRTENRQGFLDEWYDDVLVYQNWDGMGARDIRLEEGGSADVSIELAPGAFIKGRVVDDSAETAPFTRGFVWVLNLEGGGSGFGIQPDGTYKAGPLPAGTYRMRTECALYAPCVDEFYDNVAWSDSETADLVTVEAGQTLSEVDFQLHRFWVEFGEIQVVPSSSSSLDVWLPYSVEEGYAPSGRILWKEASEWLWVGDEGMPMQVLPDCLYCRIPADPEDWPGRSSNDPVFQPLVEGRTYDLWVRAPGFDLTTSVLLSPNTVVPEEGSLSSLVLPGGVSVGFSEVTVSGYTSVAVSEEPPTLPNGFEVAGVSYELETTAQFTGPITVSFPYDPEVVSDPRILHYENDAWIDVTTRVDDEECLVYGEVLSLSPFVVAKQVPLPPEVTSFIAPQGPVSLGTLVKLSIMFTDPNVADTHTVKCRWGDGSDGSWVVSGGDGVWRADASHTYGSAGVYPVSVTITDLSGLSVTYVHEYVVVYDPEGGFVTGGGWIDSPAGAYAADPELEGRATFGFVSRYKKGATVPTGSTQFRFSAGDLDFQSAAYDWLVVSGAKATYKGTGTINGAGEYGFMLSAVDAALTPSTDVDLFRIKIWDKATGDIVYDNQMGAMDTDDLSTALGGGSIVIHK